MVLGLPDVELTGVTTVADPDGRRAGYVRLLLQLLGHDEVPVAVGAGVSSTDGRPMGGIPDHTAFWGELPVPPSVTTEPGAAHTLLQASIERGATIVGIGPSTNLAALERARPGSMARARVVLMGGWLGEMRPGYPPWDPQRDWNVRCDVEAALTVARTAGDITWCTIPATIDAQLRERDLPELRATGTVGELLARQSVAHRAESGKGDLVGWPGIADDLVNFHWDPVATAAALGASAVQAAEVSATVVREGRAVRLVPSPSGRPMRVIEGVDPASFTRYWLEAVRSAQAGSSGR